MFELDDIKEAPARVDSCSEATLKAAAEHNRRMLATAHGCCGHRVDNKIVSHGSSYPRISPLEADLMDLMGDALGG